MTIFNFGSLTAPPSSGAQLGAIPPSLLPHFVVEISDFQLKQIDTYCCHFSLIVKSVHMLVFCVHSVGWRNYPHSGYVRRLVSILGHQHSSLDHPCNPLHCAISHEGCQGVLIVPSDQIASMKGNHVGYLLHNKNFLRCLQAEISSGTNNVFMK